MEHKSVQLNITGEKSILKSHEVAQVSIDRSSDSFWHHPVVDTILFSNLINVILVIVLLIWLVRKFNLFSSINKKREEIVECIKHAEDEKRIKENQLYETQKKIDNAKQEVKKIIDHGEKVASDLADRNIQAAEKEASDLLKKAKAYVKTERQIASGKVAEKITLASFALAEEHIKNAMTDELHKQFIDEFIDSLDRVKV